MKNKNAETSEKDHPISVSGWLQKIVVYVVHLTLKNKSFFYKLEIIQTQQCFSRTLWKNTNCSLKALACIWKNPIP